MVLLYGQTRCLPILLQSKEIFRLPCQPQAMFKVLNKTPPIPETLSPEGKDFLNCCFRRNPADRPSAAMLLEHAFVRNSHDQNVAATTHKSCSMNLMVSAQVHGKLIEWGLELWIYADMFFGKRYP